ncbi:hypothetical protein [uncultured Chitinophaga sp.]|jgi:hypothetical protein|uniref:hypothetical protein n=1 Tax=uncultured Chitinophaga sp. TaxID=339340 RepID=UPI00262E04B9|nr:hypothetical protein [uncultured Chitinophaga sp.]
MTRQKILVIYYSQTGQLKRIADVITGPLQQQANIVYEEIIPVQPFPFPWNKQEFFDTMPETVLGRPRGIQPLKVDPDTPFDLVILAFQPWFLSPSQPVAAFLQSQEAARLLKGRNVITLIGARNMWLNALETVKKYLYQLGACLVGNIALVDTAPNLVSVITIVRWQFKGKKEATRFLPPAGVQEKDIQAAARFAVPIREALQRGNYQQVHQQLLALDAVTLKPNLVLLENRGMKAFRFWSAYISAKGGPGAPERQPRLFMYRTLLLLGIIALSPLTAISSMITLRLKRNKLQEEVAYFKGVSLR